MKRIDIDVIKNALLTSEELSDYEKRVLMYSLYNLKDNELVNVTKENVRDRLIKVLDDLKKADPTTLTEERIKIELVIIDVLANPKASRKDIIEASFKVDCLCFNNDLPLEKTNTAILKVLQKQNDKGKSK